MGAGVAGRVADELPDRPQVMRGVADRGSDAAAHGRLVRPARAGTPIVRIASARPAAEAVQAFLSISSPCLSVNLAGYG